MRILGISAYYHDSAAALLVDGEIAAAAQEERFSRRKHDPGFPRHAVAFCLRHAGIVLRDIDYVVYYEKPLLKFERLLETYLAVAPRGFRSFLASMPLWLREKLFLKRLLREELTAIGRCEERDLPRLLFSEHHESHAASAFFPSPFEQAAVLCMDGVGEWASLSLWLGDNGTLVPQWQLDFPHSLGLLYSAFTYQAGFRVNAGEYKLMGLAPYGEPRYVKRILENVLDLKEDGTFRMNMQYFGFTTGLTMTTRLFDDLFDGPPRLPESPITRREMDLACSVQQVTEEIVLRLARTAYRDLGVPSLCLAGGVALNWCANGRLMRDGPFRDIWIQPAAGDAGAALGAALAAWHRHVRVPSRPMGHDALHGTFLGPSYSNDEIGQELDDLGAVYTWLADEELVTTTAELLAQGMVIGWFQGRMEFGPRALGARSILADARDATMQTRINRRIKFRESFRPFAPCVLEEDAARYFELDRASPYMMITAPVRSSDRLSSVDDHGDTSGIERRDTVRSAFPAVTHIDCSARIQTVDGERNDRLYRLLRAFKVRTGAGVLLNTSFNVRGEPIVNTPADAYRCFMRTGMDYLIMENMMLRKADQPGPVTAGEALHPFDLD